MKMKVFRTGNCSIHLLPVIKGLSSETQKVEKAFSTLKPDTVAVSLSREEVDGLRNIPDDYEPELSRYEELYVRGLSRYGKVSAPPPCYVATIELADHGKIPLIPVDLDEEAYTELYCAAVPGTTLFRHSTRTWLLKMKSFNADTPEEFVKAWDRAVNKLRGFGVIEAKRAETIASGILKASERSRILLAVVEVERAGDVSGLLEGLGRQPLH
jgi:hypothetical protein